MKQRPPAVFTLAVLGLLMGGLGFCLELLGTSWPFIDAATGGLTFPESGEGQKLTLGKTWAEVGIWGIAVLGLFLCPLLIVAGIGLLRMRPWARKLILICAIIMMIACPCSGTLAFYDWCTSPVEVEPDDDASDKVMAHAYALTGLVLEELVDVMAFVYGLAVVITMRRPHIRAAFANDCIQRSQLQ